MYDAAVEIRPMPGESVAGDIGVVCRTNNKVVVALLDVAGHGPEAHALAGRSRALLERWAADTSPGEFISALHEQVHGTRGLVASVCVIDVMSLEMRYVTVGNVTSRLYRGTSSHSLFARPGLIGHRALRLPKEKKLVLCAGDVLVMHSDGVASDFRLRCELRTAPSADIAASIIRDFGKKTDDASCLVCKIQPA